MAIFNPDVKDVQAPNFLGLSRPISEGVTDKTSAVTVAGIGNLIDTALKATDATVKADIDQSVYSSVDTERDSYTVALQRAKEGVTGTATPQEIRVQDPLSLLPADEAASMPQDLTNLPSFLGNLKSSADAKKISSTYYYGRLNAAAKELRSQYPGWRDYIDQKFAEVSGLNPANKYYESLISDINRASEGTASERNKILTMIRDNLGIPGMDNVYSAYKEGRVSDDEVVSIISKRKVVQEQLKMNEAIRNDNKGSAEERKATAVQDATKLGASMIGTYFENVAIKAGLASPGKINDFLTKVQTGQITISDEQARQLGETMRATRRTAEMNLRKEIFRVNSAGRSIASDLGGPKQAEEMIASFLTPFDTVVEDVYNNKWGPAFANMNAVDSMTNDTTAHLMRDKNLGDYFRKQAAARKIGGDAYSQKLFERFLVNNVDSKLKTFVNDVDLDVATQPDIRTEKGLMTLDKAVRQMRGAGVNPPQAGQRVMQYIDDLTDPKIGDGVKLNIAMAAFSPENRDFLRNFKVDGIDPNTGKPVSGRYAVYQKMTAPEVVNTIQRLSKDNPQLKDNYINWVKESFGLNLFRTELNDLRNIQLSRPDMYISWISGDKNTAPRFGVGMEKDAEVNLKRTIPGWALMSGPVQKNMEFLNQQVNRLNSGLRGLASISKLDGSEDVDEYVLRTLMEAGFDPTAGTKDIKGIPDEMARAIALSRAKKQIKK